MSVGCLIQRFHVLAPPSPSQRNKPKDEQLLRIVKSSPIAMGSTLFPHDLLPSDAAGLMVSKTGGTRVDMARKMYAPEKITGRLCEAAVALAEGATVAELRACGAVGQDRLIQRRRPTGSSIEQRLTAEMRSWASTRRFERRHRL
jgi:hypothetical protein